MKKKSESGVALFMVISTLTLLALLVAELTYSTQVHSRLAYNSIDILKATYLAKAAYRLSLVRLSAYQQVKKFLNEPNNKIASALIPANMIEQLWNFPFQYPIPELENSLISQKDSIAKFKKQSGLPGEFSATIFAESSKLNLNQLLIKEAPVKSQSNTSQKSGSNSANIGQAGTAPADFKQLLQPMIQSLIDQKRNEDTAFAETYRYLNAADLIAAIEAYIFPNSPPSNLPGFQPVPPKEGPFYSITELHLIPGIDDEIYNLISPALTVYSTPGININTISKKALISLIPTLTEEDAENFLAKRDDPDVGKPWSDVNEFWKALQDTPAGRDLQEIQDRLRQANIQLITSDETFRIQVRATVGLATRYLDAVVRLNANAPSAPKNQSTPTQSNPAANIAQQNNRSSLNKNLPLNLIYWRML